ncbi:MAG TPA: DUF4440 domain-containing protein [Longimicrobiales bacterium]|nr:DUF4440 domain-containing protein [Longimicrobiales bacterium]
MMRFVKVLVAVLAVSAIVATARSTAQEKDVRAAIEAANKQFIAAFGKGDAAGLAAMYSSTGVAYPPNSEPVSGRAALQKLWQDAMGMGVKAVNFKITEIEAHGDTAIEVGGYEMLGEGGKHIDHGKYVVIWKREQGQWKLHRDIWNTSMPAASK